MTTTISGTNGIDKVAAGAIEKADLPAGTVLQVVSVTKTNNESYSLATGTLADISGLSATITPSSATSKILVMFSVQMGGDSSATHNPYVVLDRNGTSISLGDATGSRTRTTAAAGYLAASNYTLSTVAQNVLDSPATTSPVTYKLRCGAFLSRMFFINRTNVDNSEGNTATSSITLMEIAA